MPEAAPATNGIVKKAADITKADITRDERGLANIQRALSSLLTDREPVGQLSTVLMAALPNGRIIFDDAARLCDDAEEILLLAWEWRMLLPVRTVKSHEWDDRVLIADSGEVYELPNLIRYLLEEASRTGEWNPPKALAGLFRKMGDPHWRKMPALVEQLCRGSTDLKVTGTDISRISIEMDVGHRLDAIIGALKGSGVMSPRLASLAQMARADSPIYELNPCLVVRG